MKVCVRDVYCVCIPLSEQRKSENRPWPPPGPLSSSIDNETKWLEIT